MRSAGQIACPADPPASWDFQEKLLSAIVIPMKEALLEQHHT
jgi:hypothetical protein